MRTGHSERLPCSPAERPLLYDLAYDVFDVSAECDQVVALARRHGLARLRRVLDVGCGTGHHARHLAALGLSVTAVDSDRHMLRRARRLAQKQHLPTGAIEFVAADMRRLAIAPPADLAICLGASFNSLVSESDGVRAFGAVGAVLRPGGVFLLELHDPSSTYGDDLTARWTVDRALARIRGRFTMSPRSNGTYRWDIVIDADFAGGRRRRALFRTNARPWTRRDIGRLCRASGTLQLAGWHCLANAGEAPRIFAALSRARPSRPAGGRARSRHS